MSLHNHGDIISPVTNGQGSVLRESSLDPANRYRLLFRRDSATNNDFALAAELDELFFQFRICLHLGQCFASHDQSMRRVLIFGLIFFIPFSMLFKLLYD